MDLNMVIRLPLILSLQLLQFPFDMKIPFFVKARYLYPVWIHHDYAIIAILGKLKTIHKSYISREQVPVQTSGGIT